MILKEQFEELLLQMYDILHEVPALTKQEETRN
jgi:hypothetical protein